MNTEECEGRCRDFFAKHGALGVEHEVRDDDMLPRTFVYLPSEDGTSAIRYEADALDVFAVHTGTLRVGDEVILHPPDPPIDPV